MLWSVLTRKVPQASQHLCPSGLLGSCDFCWEWDTDDYKQHTPCLCGQQPLFLCHVAINMLYIMSFSLTTNWRVEIGMKLTITILFIVEIKLCLSDVYYKRNQTFAKNYLNTVIVMINKSCIKRRNSRLLHSRQCAANCLQHICSSDWCNFVQVTFVTWNMPCATWYKGTAELLSLTECRSHLF